MIKDMNVRIFFKPVPKPKQGYEWTRITLIK